MKINIAYDTSVMALQATNVTLYNNYTAAANEAVNNFQNAITNNLTITVHFGWGEAGGSTISPGVSGQSSRQVYDVTYTALINAVKATDVNTPVQTAAAATLSTTDPTNGQGRFSLAPAEASVLGLNTTGFDLGGSVGIDSSAPWFWSQMHPAPSPAQDAVGVFEHEISEVLGRSAQSGTANQYTLLDLFRYTAAGGNPSAAIGTAAGARAEPFQAGYDPNTQTYFSYDGTTVTLPFETGPAVNAGADVADWSSAAGDDAFADAVVDGKAHVITATDLQLLNVMGFSIACFLTGTGIATPAGEKQVQDLRAGDLVRTADGSEEPIVWIGHSKALSPRGSRNAATPVIVRQGALAANIPDRDLYITKGHSLYFDGVLIPAEFLVNHRTILWDDRGGETEVYHIELARHAILLANGAPAESYRDDGNMWMFHNARAASMGDAIPPCAPVLTGGVVVDAIWRHLLDRAGPRSVVPLANDPEPMLAVGGKTLSGKRTGEGRYSFRPVGCRGDVRLLSRAAAPDRLGIARDPRVLGLPVSRIVVWRGARAAVTEAGDPILTDGFHDYEPAGRVRWTDGDAGLPDALFAGDAVTSIDVYVSGSTFYPFEVEVIPLRA